MFFGHIKVATMDSVDGVSKCVFHLHVSTVSKSMSLHSVQESFACLVSSDYKVHSAQGEFCHMECNLPCLSCIIRNLIDQLDLAGP